MKVLIIASCAADGEHLEAGEDYELPAALAETLIQLGRAVKAVAVEEKPKATRKAKTNGTN